jgi:RepB DNA-primase from phage plasmid
MTQTKQFTPRLLSATEYVLALHRHEDRVALLLRNRPWGQTMQRILAAEAVASPPFQDWLGERSESGAAIFLGMNPLRHNSCARTKECILEIRHVYLDLDEDGPASLRAIRTTGDVPIPNFVLDTSPEKNQVVWRVDHLSQAEAESLLRSLAAQFRGDPAATDVSRVLRVPGFRNQSEADWAYAKRALARGDDPEEIIHRIADYRSEDKADPHYYARHTVSKAQAQNAHDSAHLPVSKTFDLPPIGER